MSASSDPGMHAMEPGQGTAHRWTSPRTITALILREMSTRYGRNPGGYIWAILEPLGIIVILSFGFSLLMRSPSLGNSFLLFYASGYLVFNLYQNLSLTVSKAIRFSRPLLMYPVVTWVDAILARFILNLLTSLLVTYILITGILATVDSRAVLEMGPIAEALALAALLGLGVGTLNCAIGGLYPTYELIWSIATRPLFLVSGIFYIYEDMPQNVQDVLWYNPLIHITGLMRSGIYPTYHPLYISEIFILIISLSTLLMGLILLGRYHRDILNR
ncbi:ABC transporter permease [Ruegeria jejuensis]|uniref:ABC transporter permease n=1 Tax=Ruegeria jejuensis TaxID=3233338 RepID=UPI00355C7B25